MAKKNNRILTILGAVLGTSLTVVGIRQGAQYFRRKQLMRRAERQISESSWAGEGHYQTIPATGVAPAAEMTRAERVNSDRVGDFDDRGTAYRTTEPLAGAASEVTGTNVRGDDAETGGTRRYGTAGEATFGVSGSGRTTEPEASESGTGSLGVSPAETGEVRSGAGMRQEGMRQTMPQQRAVIVMDEVVAPLIEHAIAFNSVMNLLRSRQREDEAHQGIESLTEGDRNSMRAVLDQMQERVGGFEESDLRKNPLALRSYNLTRKLREALDNMAYTGTDLYRIYDEVRPQLCSLARELANSGEVTITGLDHIRQLYEC